MSIFDHPLISQRYFFPRNDEPQKIEWLQTKNAQLGCLYAPLDDKAPLVVYFHGNGEVVADYQDQVSFFHSAGVSVLFFEFRGYGVSTGVPALAAMLDDVQELAELLPVPPMRCIAFGRSVGSIYAIEFASYFQDCLGLVLESAIASPLERVLLRVSPREMGVSAEELSAESDRILSHEKKMAKATCPTLLLHAEGDTLVSVENALRLFEWSSADTKTLLRFENGDHNSIFQANRAQYEKACRAFFASLQKEKTQSKD